MEKKNLNRIIVREEICGESTDGLIMGVPHFKHPIIAHVPNFIKIR